MKSLLTGPLMLGAFVVVARVVIERTGIMPQIAPYLSAAALTVLIAPVYFALKIVAKRMPRPYVTHLKATVLYAVLVRAMIIPVYWLAFFYKWPEARFAMPPDAGTGPLAGYVIVPFLTGIFWVFGSTVVGGILGILIIGIGSRLARGK
jgi:hypothetical protein